MKLLFSSQAFFKTEFSKSWILLHKLYSSAATQVPRTSRRTRPFAFTSFFFYLSVANHTQSCFRRGLFYVTDSWGFETSFGRPARLWNLLPLLLVSITASHSSSTAGPPLSLFIATVFHTNEPEWLSFVTAGRSRNRGWCGLKCFYSTGLWQWCVTYWRILVFGLCPSPIFGSKLSSVFSQGRA